MSAPRCGNASAKVQPGRQVRRRGRRGTAEASAPPAAALPGGSPGRRLRLVAVSPTRGRPNSSSFGRRRLTPDEPPF